MKILELLSFLFKHLFIALILGLRPLLGPPARCCFVISCTEYAVMQLNQQTLHNALVLIAKRLLACQPFGHRRL